ncbi:hypothetical protein V8C86DRAFT_2563457 [Haematococcus lacustris]
MSTALSARRLTGIQRQVFTLYRQVCRGLRVKRQQGCNEEQLATFRAFARTEFHRFSDVNPKNFMLVEHLLRSGSKKLSLILSPTITSIHIKESSSSSSYPPQSH